MNYRVVSSCTLYLLFAALLGCATLPSEPQKPLAAQDPFRAFPEEYRRQALEYENRGALRRALFSWQIVTRFRPDDEEAVQHAEALRSRIQSETERHFSKGLAYLQQNLPQAARDEFLRVLVYDPEHEQALHHVLHEATSSDYRTYVTEAGDTPKSIAKKAYDDSDKDFLIAYFNDLEDTTTLEPGLTLKLPILEPALTAQPTYPDERLKTARAMLSAHEYERALTIAQGILEYEPDNNEASELAKASKYQLGRASLREKRYLRALRLFQDLDLEYRDVRQIVGFVERHLQNKAELHYRKGVTYFVSERYDKAAKEWNETLRLNPEHPRAKKDLDKANRLLDRLKALQ